MTLTSGSSSPSAQKPLQVKELMPGCWDFFFLLQQVNQTITRIVRILTQPEMTPWVQAGDMCTSRPWGRRQDPHTPVLEPRDSVCGPLSCPPRRRWQFSGNFWFSRKPLATSQTAGVGWAWLGKGVLLALLNSALLDPGQTGKGRKYKSHSRNTHTHKTDITHSIKSKKAFLVLVFCFWWQGFKGRTLIFWLTFTLAKNPCYKKEEEIKLSYRKLFQRMTKQ